ncbi:MAG TPA: carboxypeptidase regulatory-like domain-containing protein, partial [Blastocatellia bacterium]|nr:carboxypeptidase regulatory-like domain-containing protein [Blastocatellia bacterium]
MLFSVSVLSLIFQLTAGVAPAQSRAMLSGKVSDQRGGVIAGTVATLWQRATGFERNVRTDESGAFKFENLVEGDYRLTVSAKSFGVLTREISLSSAESANVVLTLHPAAIAEEIVVNGTQLAETPEEVKRIPGAVDFVDKTTLENSRVFNFAEALRKVSGINV